MIKTMVLPDLGLIRSIFQPIIGQSCWGTKRITGSIISFEFGVVARLPKPSPYYARRAQENPSANLPIKMIPSGGEWNFSLVDAEWHIFVQDIDVNSLSSTGSEMEIAIELINGQILEKADWQDDDCLLLTFREGAKIFARIDKRYDADSDMWWLIQTNGPVATFSGYGLLTLTEPDLAANHPK